MLKAYKKPFLPLIVKWGSKVEANQFCDPPVFIGGCGRSGTTLLLSILSAHKDIFACPKELGAFNKIEADENGYRTPKRIDRLYTSLIINQIPRQARRLCEKSPSNVKHIDDIANYYRGNFRFIHIIRDGRDVVLSKHPTAKDRYWVGPQRWVNDVRSGLPIVTILTFIPFSTKTWYRSLGIPSRAFARSCISSYPGRYYIGSNMPLSPGTGLILKGCRI
ncbi:MAG: hypothetical protein BRD50_00415 [Bacteroidetes bacterium SW_11_45_7]|nr:MAG: hypothetical protein BRD50_00415 [Bacteroidetes bacterium SW_11_45_7]